MSDSNEEQRLPSDRDFGETGYTDSSPLIGHHHGEEDEAQDTKSEPLSILTLIALTCVNGGLQVFFSTTMANLAVCLPSFSDHQILTAEPALPPTPLPFQIR